MRVICSPFLNLHLSYRFSWTAVERFITSLKTCLLSFVPPAISFVITNLPIITRYTKIYQFRYLFVYLLCSSRLAMFTPSGVGIENCSIDKLPWKIQNNFYMRYVPNLPGNPPRYREMLFQLEDNFGGEILNTALIKWSINNFTSRLILEIFLFIDVI